MLFQNLAKPWFKKILRSSILKCALILKLHHPGCKLYIQSLPYVFIPVKPAHILPRLKTFDMKHHHKWVNTWEIKEKIIMVFKYFYQ